MHFMIPKVLLMVSVALFVGACSKVEEMIPIPNTEKWAAKLSAYEVYEGNWSDLTPTSDFHLLELNADLFANYAQKQRLVKLPHGTQMHSNGNEVPDFPNGTILVKTFYYFKDNRDASLGKKVIETRLLIKREGLWNVATYVWNSEQTEATLSLDGFDTQIDWINTHGDERSIAYHVPSQTECISCHQLNSEVVPIGPSLRNLNIEVVRGGSSISQLEHLQSIDLLNTININQISHIPNFYDTNVSLEERGRAYLDMNCAHCHNPSAWSKPARKRFDFRFEKSIAETGILDEKSKIEEVMREGEMPYLGTTILHEEGLDLIVEYLESL